MHPHMDKPHSLENITAFINRNIVPASFARLACGDGRYDGDQSKESTRIFGEDMGALAALWKAGNYTSVEDCVRDYRIAKAKVLKNFGTETPEEATLYLHTDGHGDEAHGVYGCGHMKNLANGKHAEMYGLDGVPMNELFQYVLKNANPVVTNLKGDHKEEMVILVHGTDGQVPNHSVRSQDPETGEMHFVVDIDRVNEYYRKLAEVLGNEKITPKALQDAYLNQQGVTAGILAGGKPVVHVAMNAEGKAESITFDDNDVPAIQ